MLTTKNSLIAKGDTIFAALSGGADSIALTHMLLELSKTLDFSLKAAHVNHCLRGAESDRDEELVRDFCERLGIELYTKRIDCLTVSRERGEGIEAAARFARYSFFAELGGKTATAHTLSDNAETLLMHAVRGCTLDGLCGIREETELFGARVIRPILHLTREEIEKYCAYNHLTYITDSSNLETDYTRNKIRLEVMPLLKSLNPRVEHAIGSLITSAKADRAQLDALTSAELDTRVWLGRLDINGLELPQRVIAAFLAALGAQVSSETVDSVISRPTTNVSCSDGARHRIINKNGYIYKE